MKRDGTEAIGLESGTVRVMEYDTRWAELYAFEAARIREVLAARGLSLVLEHTGSTAVPGLAAKPIIDILAGCRESEPRDPLIAAIESAGYLYRGEQGIPGRDFFRFGSPRSHHLHLASVGSDFWRDHRAFRDRLRADPFLRDAYAALKRDLARRHPFDREAYIEGKTRFVLGVLASAER